MYEPTPHPDVIATADQRYEYNVARDVAGAFLQAQQPAFVTFRELTMIERSGARPLTFDERNQLADACLNLARALDQAAAAWDAYRPDLALSRIQRKEAREYRDRAALNRAVAVIAPDHPGDDPFGG